MSTVDQKTTPDVTPDDGGPLSTQPDADAPKRIRGHGMVVQLRRWWRYLTSMRTALILLFLLALAAIPGTVFPQRGLNPLKVDQYFAAHPDLAPILDRLYAFDVYAAPWFAAIYLLLFISLIGCLVPRFKLHAKAMVRKPPAAPKHFTRLPTHDEFTAASADTAAIRAVLRKGRWRTTVRTTANGTVEISGEKGYLRETGNLVFHFALLAILAGLASGAMWGWRASALVVEGNAFCNTVQAYDQFTPGRAVAEDALAPFCVQLDDFSAEYLANGQPVQYTADVKYSEGDEDPTTPYRLQVNDPLRMDGANVYLINHGYAPILRYTDRYGTVFEGTPAFLPQDLNQTSEGVFVLPDANQDPKSDKTTPGVQMAFEGIYMPTRPPKGQPPITSQFPAERDPAITLLAYRGDTGLNTGIPHSVYSLNQDQIQSGKLTSIGSKLLTPGETWTLDDGSSITFVGTKEWASLQINQDPGQIIVLGGAVAAVLGLVGSLTVRRRRIWFRTTVADGRTVISAGGLARNDAASFDAEFRRTVAAAKAAVTSGSTRVKD